jgi:hypothetical protein
MSIWVVRLLTLLLVVFFIGCVSRPKDAAISSAAEYFSVKASSTRTVSDRPYILLEQEVEGDDNFKIALRVYINYALNYQGYAEDVVSDPDAIYVSYSFGPSEKSESEKCLELVAFSKRVYDSTNRIVPIWIVNSCHQGHQSDVLALLPMFALSIRDVAGKNASLYQSSRSYQADDEVAKNIADEVRPTLQIFKER